MDWIIQHVPKTILRRPPHFLLFPSYNLWWLIVFVHIELLLNSWWDGVSSGISLGFPTTKNSLITQPLIKIWYKFGCAIRSQLDHHGSSGATHQADRSACIPLSWGSHAEWMQWVCDFTWISTPAFLPYVKWGRSHYILFRSCLAFGGLGKVDKSICPIIPSIQFSWQGVVPNSMGWCHLAQSTGVSIIGTRMSIWYLTSFYIHVGIVSILCASSQHLIVYDGRIWAQTECVLPGVKTLWW